jgi:large subunit ribosomal protein L19
VQNSVIEKIEKTQIKKRPKFEVGDRINVSVRLKEGDKERIQAFRGVVISKSPKSGKSSRATFTVRKISEGVGVERIFPLHSPYIEAIAVETSAIVRRSRLYYLRSLEGKKARLKEAERFGDDLIAAEEPVTVTAETVAPTTPEEAAAAKEAAPKAPDTTPKK